MNRNHGSLPGRLREVKARGPAGTKPWRMRANETIAKAAAGVFGLALLLCPGEAAGASISTRSLLDDLRKAMLTRPLAGIYSISIAGKVEIFGLGGTAQEWDDLRGGRFTRCQEAGAQTGCSGWDARTAWSQDYSGLVTIDAGTAGRLQAIDQAYMNDLRYLRPDAGGATVIYAGRRSDGDDSYDVLAITPPQGSELDLWLETRSHLIARETASIGTVSFTSTFSNYQRVEGILYPFDISTRTSSGNSFSVRLSSLAVNDQVGERMRVPAQSVRDFSIAGGTTTVPIQVVNNHIYVSGRLNGHGPYTFVLDSGGDYIVTPQVAAAAQAQSAGGIQLQGVGAATEGAAFTHMNSIAVGNATVRDQYMLVLPIATGFGMAEGMRIDGMIGYQFLARFLTTIDYANSKITLTMPGAGPASIPGAAAVPFYIDGTIPRIQVGVDAVTTSAEVDTGNRAGLELSSPFLAAHPAIAAYAKTPPGVVGFGVGGPAYARLGRVPALQIGPYTIPNPITSFSVGTEGAFADPYDPANVGSAIWRRFDVTFDYPHHQLLLAKSADFNTPFSYDRSGLFVIDQNGLYTILSVLPGTPAAAAGLAKGDVILTINGATASSDSLAALRALLSNPPGTVVHLQVRGVLGAIFEVAVKLADYV